MKRANGTGSIVRKNGRSNPYIVYGPTVRVDGKRHTPYLGSFRTSAEAHTFLERYNQNPSGERFKMTFSALWEEYKGGKKYLKLSKSSKEGYTAAYKKCASLHSKRFSELRTPQFQNIIDQMEEDGASGSAMDKVKILLGLLSSYAIQTDVLSRNYASGIVLPDTKETDKRAISDVEFEIIRKESDNSDTAKILLYLIYSGWRIGEALELTVFSYDAKEKLFQGGKKTKNGKNRIVPVHPTVQPIVDYFIGKRGKTVFCRDDGEAITPNYFRNYMLKPFIEEHNLSADITPHMMRHTFATYLKEHGADEYYRRCLLGHSHDNITDKVYTHANIEKLRETVLLVEKPKKEEKNISEDKKRA
ncbi:MAG: tyrosine-type recombinase/integrase [Acutalibacteraceae bacterium]